MKNKQGGSEINILAGILRIVKNREKLLEIFFLQRTNNCGAKSCDHRSNFNVSPSEKKNSKKITQDKWTLNSGMPGKKHGKWGREKPKRNILKAEVKSNVESIYSKIEG